MVRAPTRNGGEEGSIAVAMSNGAPRHGYPMRKLYVQSRAIPATDLFTFVTENEENSRSCRSVKLTTANHSVKIDTLNVLEL